MRYDVPIYDPFKEPGENYFHPADDVTQYLVYIRQIYSDIARLAEMMHSISDDYSKKLLTKYIVTECLSMDKYIRILANIILSKKTEYHVDEASLHQLGKLYKSYKFAWKQHFAHFKNIRNKIGAHRELLALVTIHEIWNSIDIPKVVQFLNQVPPLFNYMKSLNIYRWTKTEKDEMGHKVIAFVQPLIFSKIE